MKTQLRSVDSLPQLLDEGAVAAQLGISPRHLRSLRYRRLIPYLKLGKAVRFDPGAVAAAVARLTVTSPARQS